METARKSRLLVARRWLPDSIASRLVLTVVLALLLTQAVSALVYLTDRPPGPPAHSMRVLVQRVTAIVQLVESTPPQERRRLVKAIDDPVLRVDWNPETPRFANQREGFPFDRLRRAIRGELDDPDRAVVVEVRRERPMPGPFPVDEHRWGADVRLSVGLKDGSWLTFVGGDPLEGPFRLLRFALWMAGIVGAVALVSVWTARRMTAPIARFADAAERLGVDGEAPPLPEAGPQELRAATRAFNRMQARLARFVADRTQMLAAMSHDLRTPLTRMKLALDMLGDGPEVEELLTDVTEMETMIEGYLAFARGEGTEAVQPTDLTRILNEVVSGVRREGAEVALAAPDGLTLPLRPNATRRCLANLLSNARRHGDRIWVRAEREDGFIDILVDDDGPGIPQASRDDVFKPFFRLDSSRNQATGGAGLGLTIARDVVRSHGGDITLSDSPYGGLRVLIRLPV